MKIEILQFSTIFKFKKYSYKRICRRLFVSGCVCFPSKRTPSWRRNERCQNRRGAKFGWRIVITRFLRQFHQFQLVSHIKSDSPLFLIYSFCSYCSVFRMSPLKLRALFSTQTGSNAPYAFCEYLVLCFCISITVIRLWIFIFRNKFLTLHPEFRFWRFILVSRPFYISLHPYFLKLLMNSRFQIWMDTVPIGGLTELFEWTEEKFDASHTTPLRNYRATNGPELLLCHDMKGGYLDEER